MSKILVFTDTHWSSSSSIVCKKEGKYTQRLNNLINTMNWLNKTAVEQNCDFMICCGDMMDKSCCSDIELTALKDIEWNKLPCYFLCGNHESSVLDLRFNSVKVFEDENHYIIDTPLKKILDDKTDLYFIPYITEDVRKPIKDYLKDLDTTKHNIIFSHNDIKGISYYGKFVSEEGFSLDEIEANCDLFINGHLHNGGFLNSDHTILNLGNITGQNFNEDGFKYSHNACIIDTDSMEVNFIENPYAFNFYKFDINTENDLKKLLMLKNNAVVSIRCLEKYVSDVKEMLANLKNIAESRVVILRDLTEIELQETTIEINNENYLTQFADFIYSKIGKNDIVDYELAEVCK